MSVYYDEHRGEVYLTGPHLRREIDRRAEALIEQHLAFCRTIRPQLAALADAIRKHMKTDAAQLGGPNQYYDWSHVIDTLTEATPGEDEGAEADRVRDYAEMEAERGV